MSIAYVVTASSPSLGASVRRTSGLMTFYTRIWDPCCSSPSERMNDSSHFQTFQLLDVYCRIKQRRQSIPLVSYVRPILNQLNDL